MRWSVSSGPTSAPAGTSSTAASSGAATTRGPTRTRPANGPAAILAARLHRRYGDPADLDWARRIAGWLQETLVDPGSGIVWDGTHPYEDPSVDRTVWTYNQGTVVGAEVQLWQLTGDRVHLDRARRTATATLNRYGEGGFPVEGSR